MHLSRTANADVPRGAWWVWGVAAGFYFVALFHRMTLGVASLEAEHRFHISSGTLAAFTGLQLGLYLSMQVPAGLAADRVGPRRTLAFGLACMALGEVAFGTASSLPVGLAGRALVGIGDAFVFINVLRLAQNWFPVRRYALLASLTGLAGALGQILTTVPLGAALGALGWTATFAASGALTALLVVVCLVAVRDRPGASGPARAQRVPGHEGIARTLRLAWREPATRHGFWAHFGLMGPFVTITALWGYPYLVESQGMAPGAARALLLVTVAVFAAGSPALGALAARAPRRRAGLAAGLAALLTGVWSATLLWPGGHPPTGLLAAAFALTGLGGAAALLAFDLSREGNPAHRAGSASGLVNTGGFLAAVAAQLAIGLLVSRAAAGSAALQTALWPMVALLALASLQLLRRARVAAPTRVGPAPAHPTRFREVTE